MPMMLQNKKQKKFRQRLCLLLALLILPVWAADVQPAKAAAAKIKSIYCCNQYDETMRFAPTGSTEQITAKVQLTAAVPEETTFRLAVDIEDADVVDVTGTDSSVLSFTVPRGRDHVQFRFLLQCKKEGKTKILISDADNSSVYAEYELTVQTPGIFPQSEIALTAEQPTASLCGVMKDGSNPAAITSSDTSVVTVNEDGDLTAQGNGTANIYFSTEKPSRTGALCAVVTVSGMPQDGTPNWVEYTGSEARKDCFVRMLPQGYTMRNNASAQYWCTEIEQIKEPVARDDLSFSLYVEGDGVGENHYDWESLPLKESTVEYLSQKVLPNIKIYEARDAVLDEAGSVSYDNYSFADYRGRLVASTEDGGLTLDQSTGLVTVAADRLQDNTRYVIAIEHSIEAPNYEKSGVDLMVNDYILFKTTDPSESFEHLVGKVSDYAYSEAMGRLLQRCADAYAALSDADREKTDVQEAYRQYQYYQRVYNVTKEICNIGTVSRDSGDAITNCRKDYDALDAEQKALVGDDVYQQLTAAEAEYARIQRIPVFTSSQEYYNVKYSRTPFMLDVTSNSESPLHYTSEDPSICTVTSEGQVRTTGIGTTYITVSTDATANHDAGSTQIQVRVEKGTQTITASTNYNNTSFSLHASCDSGAALSYVSSDPGVATVSSSGTVRVVGTGMAVITIVAPATKYYKAATRNMVYYFTASSSRTYTVGSLKYKIVRAAGKSTGGVTVSGPKRRSLTRVSIPATVRISGKTYKVQYISASALRSCTKLTSVTIGSNVTKIGSKAFYGDKKLKKITVKTKKLTSVGSKALTGIYRKAVIKVPKSKYTKYKKLFRGRRQAKTVRVKK